MTITCIEPGFVKSEMLDRLDGHAPTPFVAETEDAVARFCRAIERGQRGLAWPYVHAIPARSLALIPAAIYEPLAQRASQPQVAYARSLLEGRGSR